jgi:hypothetical protein
MQRLNTGVALGLWAATAVAAFALGRLAAPRAEPPPADLGAAVRAALGEPDLLLRLGRTASLLEHLDAETLPGVLAIYDGLLAVVGQSDIRPFLAAWARFDPEGALDHALAWPYQIKREIGVEAAIEAWAQRDPDAARAAYERIGEERPEVRDQLFLGLLAGWVHSGGDGLDAYLAELPPAVADSATGVAVGALMRRGGPEATLRWADSILHADGTDARFAQSVFRRAARSAARCDPERTAAWALSHAGSGYALDGLRLVAEQWAGRDGRAALAWLRERAAGEPREQAVRAAFVQWSKVDPDGAQAWLAAEELSEFHAPALDAHARRLAAPEEAVGWCERILDATRRRGCLKTVATRWYRKDAAAAEAWLASSSLDEATRNQVRASANRPRAQRGLRPRAR